MCACEHVSPNVTQALGGGGMRQRGHQFGENKRQHCSATCPRGLFAVVTWVIHTAFVCKGYGGAGGRRGAGLEDDRWWLSFPASQEEDNSILPSYPPAHGPRHKHPDWGEGSSPHPRAGAGSLPFCLFITLPSL